jgi:hypothetical protein
VMYIHAHITIDHATSATTGARIGLCTKISLFLVLGSPSYPSRPGLAAWMDVYIYLIN